MNLKDQTIVLLGMILDPKKTVRSLPSNQFCIMSLITSLLLPLPKIISTITAENPEANQFIARVVPQLIWFIFFFILFSYILRFIAKLIHRPISLKKAMNIIGYSQAPRVLVEIVVSILAWMVPAVQKPGGFNTILDTVVYLATIYSLALIVFGVNWSFEGKTSDSEEGKYE